MKWRRVLSGLIVVLILGAGSAWAENAQTESIKGRLGITARVGAISTASSDSLDPEPSLVVGGGVIFGVTDILAIEADVVHAPDVKFYNTAGKLKTTDVSVGLQIRNRMDEFTAYLGIGADALLIDADNNGTSVDVDTVYGGHIRGGADFFFTRNVALNVDLRGSFFPPTDLRQEGAKVATYDPVSFIGTVGIRFFLY